MRLIILGLPLGNIEDISLRAIKTLKEARLIICEDTRVFNKLWMKLLSIGQVQGNFGGRLMVLNDFNEKERTPQIAESLEIEDEVVLVSDAGMPLVSDPGFRLVKEARQRGWKVDVVPGPTAAMTALALSGLSADRLLFLGFLPKKPSKREENWQAVRDLKKGLTVIIYESPFRVRKTVEEIAKVFGEETEVVIARELTKEHEEVVKDKASEVLKKLKLIKGEVVILFRV